MGSLNILITNEVRERWQALQQKQQQHKRKVLSEKGDTAEKGSLSRVNDADVQTQLKLLNHEDSVKSPSIVKNPEIFSEQTTATSQLELNLKEEQFPLQTSPSSGEFLEKAKDRLPPLSSLTLAHPGTSNDFKGDSNSNITTSSKDSNSNAAIPSKGSNGESTRTPENARNMNKLLSHFSVQNKQQNDVENANCQEKSQDYFIRPDDHFSTLFPEQKRQFQPSTTPEDLEFEEVDETTEATKNRKFEASKLQPPTPNFFLDKEAMIGLNTEKLEPEAKSLQEGSAKGFQEVRVPKTSLPIIIDKDENGKPIFEAIASWKIRDNAQKQIELNNQYWHEQLEKITAKAEDETRKEAQAFQKLLQGISDRHPDLYSSTLGPGSHCNMISAQIAKCYKENPGQILKCSDLVRQFAKCADNAMLGRYNEEQVRR